jgi:ADP-ribose pyrophosphatase YjhB (NUDIX family)
MGGGELSPAEFAEWVTAPCFHRAAHPRETYALEFPTPSGSLRAASSALHLENIRGVESRNQPNRRKRLNAPMPLAVTVHAVIFKGGDVLLGETEKKGWTLPGGHLKPRQSVFKALEAEMRQETGKKWKAKIERLCGTYMELGKHGTPKKVMFIVRGRYISGTPLGERELKAVEWVPFEEALQRLRARKNPRWRHALEDSKKDVLVYRCRE